MTWLLIVTLLVAAFGPVLWLLPSRRDRALASLRTSARRAGIEISLAELDNPDPTPQQRVSAGGKIKRPVIPCATYRRPIAQRDVNLAPNAMVIRREAARIEGLPPGWGWRQEPALPAGAGIGAVLSADWLAGFAAAVAGLPSDAEAVELMRGAVQIYWRERGLDEQPTASPAATSTPDKATPSGPAAGAAMLPEPLATIAGVLDQLVALQGAAADSIRAWRAAREEEEAARAMDQDKDRD